MKVNTFISSTINGIVCSLEELDKRVNEFKTDIEIIDIKDTLYPTYPNDKKISRWIIARCVVYK